MKLVKLKQISGTVLLRSGLHIGAGDTEMKIGGTDNPVVKHPHTLEPFIPGSSMKGKIRALLELRSGLMGMTEGKPLGVGDCSNLQGEQKTEAEKIVKLFGTSGAGVEEEAGLGPSRASFADSLLDDDWRKAALEKNWPLTEVKSENTINRIKGVAYNPRQTERVPAGTRFRFHVTLKEFEGDDGLESFLLEGFKLLEMDALGGNGSRGYGRVSFAFDDDEIQKTFDAIQPL